MDTAMSEDKLKEMLDQIIREVTEDSTGIQLVRGDAELEDDVCTVHISFRRGFRSSLSLRADTTMLTRLAQIMLEEEQVTLQDLEDATKEYFNVVCGHVAVALYKATRIAARFGVPAFHRGIYRPGNHREQFVLSYSSDRNEAAQLVHHIPVP